MLRKCLLCQTEYENVKPFGVACDPCRERVRNYPGQLLTVAERLWGKCFERDQHWEYMATRQDGRPNPIMLERRQVPAAHVALILSGKPRPSPAHVARVKCDNRSCVRPNHLEWAEKMTGIELKWGKDMGREELAAMVQHERDKRAKYQRDYRANLKRHDVRGMREVHDANLAERVAREVEMRREGRYIAPTAVPYPIAPPAVTPEAAAVPPAVVAAPIVAVPAPVELGALLGGVRIAPVE